MKKVNLCKLLILGSVLTFYSCSSDDDNRASQEETETEIGAEVLEPTQPEVEIETVVDFGEAPNSNLIPNAKSLEVVTENTVRYHSVTFISGDVSSYIVETEQEVVIVDMGFDSVRGGDDGSQLRTYVDSINKPISVIVTHNHPDHFGGSVFFKDVQIYAEASVASALSANSDFNNLYEGTVVAVEESQELGGLTFNFDALVNTETAENGYIYISEVEALFGGDLIFNKAHMFIREYSPNAGDDEIVNWVNGLQDLNLRFGSYKQVFTGHNGNSSNVSETLESNITYLNTARDLIIGSRELTSGGVATTHQEVIDELQLLFDDYSVGGLLFSLPNAFFPGDPGADWF